LIQRLGETQLIRVGTIAFGVAYASIGLTPDWVVDLVAFTLAGFGFFMFHNTMQALATQLDPNRRGTCMALFACILFGGQSLGVVICTELIAFWGSGVVLVCAGLLLTLIGVTLPMVVEVGQHRVSLA
jgi:MFS family permease